VYIFDHRWNVGREKHAQFMREAAEARIASKAVETKNRIRYSVWKRWADAIASWIEMFGRRGSF